MPEPFRHPSSATLQETDIWHGEDRFRLLVETIRDYAIFLLDPQGRIASWNAGAERLKGWSAREIVGKHFSVFYPPESVAAGWPDHELAIATAEGRFDDEGWRLRQDGSKFWAYVVITALRDEGGRLRGFAKVTRDLTERRLHEESLRRSEERFRLLVDGVRDYAIFLLDGEGLISSWNSGASAILSYRATDVLGRPFSLFLPAEDGPDAARAALDRAREQGRDVEEGWRIRKDGSRFFAHTSLTPLHDTQGRLYGYAVVIRDLTVRRKVETLEEQGRQVSEFLAMLAHELRNPLAPVRTSVALLRTFAPADPRMARATDIIDRQVTHLAHLVDDLLDVSRITRGKIALRKVTHDLAELVDAAVDNCRPVFEARSQRIEVQHAARPLAVEGDPTRLTQVVNNLLQNAAKFTGVGGHVNVATSREAGSAVLRVRDDGIGISEDLLPRVFDLFTQGERALDRSEGGLGVGLALVRRLVELHGGDVNAASEGTGRGSEFTVRLPLVPEQTPAAGAYPPPAALASRASRRVLVVDDNSDALETMELLLRALGHEVRTAPDGPSALGVVREFVPDVALLDIGLPQMDGYEVATQMRALPELAGTTLVALTGYGQDEDRRRTREAGFAHHLTKPVDPAFLARLIETSVPHAD